MFVDMGNYAIQYDAGYGVANANNSGGNMPKRKVEVKQEPAFEPEVMMGMDHYSHVALGVRVTERNVSFIRIRADGLEHQVLSHDKFLEEFSRDLLEEEWMAAVKFLRIALRNDGNDHLALATLEEVFKMKLKELKEKTMEELVTMFNELAKAQGKKEVDKFKSLEVGRLAIVKLSNKPVAKAKTKEAKAATGGGTSGRPRSGVGVFAKDVILKGGTNAEVLDKVKAKFPDNKTTVSCIAYYRNALVKAGMLEGGRKKKDAKPAKPVKGKSKKAKAPEEASA